MYVFCSYSFLYGYFHLQEGLYGALQYMLLCESSILSANYEFKAHVFVCKQKRAKGFLVSNLNVYTAKYTVHYTNIQADKISRTKLLESKKHINLDETGPTVQKCILYTAILIMSGVITVPKSSDL